MTAQSLDTQRSVDLGWIRLGYDDVGTGEIPIVLLHGAGAGATARGHFVANIPVLAQRHRVIALDLPGFGRSDTYVMKADARQTVNAAAICGLLNVLGIERANLVGYSLGGGAALTTAVDYPDMVHRMVLMGCQGTRSPLFGAQPTEGIKALHAVYREPSIETFRAFFDTMVYDGSMVSDAILEERAHGVRQEHIDAWMASQDAPHRSLALELDTVDVPTLIVHGRNDRVVPFESGIALLSELPHSELHAFNRCGHWVQYEHAEVFNELVLNFFARD